MIQAGREWFISLSPQRNSTSPKAAGSSFQTALAMQQAPSVGLVTGADHRTKQRRLFIHWKLHELGRIHSMPNNACAENKRAHVMRCMRCVKVFGLAHLVKTVRKKENGGSARSSPRVLRSTGLLSITSAKEKTTLTRSSVSLSVGSRLCHRRLLRRAFQTRMRRCRQPSSFMSARRR